MLVHVHKAARVQGFERLLYMFRSVCVTGDNLEDENKPLKAT